LIETETAHKSAFFIHFSLENVCFVLSELFVGDCILFGCHFLLLLVVAAVVVDLQVRSLIKCAWLCAVDFIVISWSLPFLPHFSGLGNPSQPKLLFLAKLGQ
jgi:hypothetical protein